MSNKNKYKETEGKGKLFVLSGPSGSGKTTLAKGLLKDKLLKTFLSRAISFTTRKKRSGEKNGKDYFFINGREFREKLKNKKILEWTKYLGYYYGTSKDFVDSRLANGLSTLLCLDLKGMLKIKQLYPRQAVSIFVMPPSLYLLQERIQKRCSKTKKKEIGERLKLAKKEVKNAGLYDYCVVNEDLKRALAESKQIVLKESLNIIS